MITIWVGGVLIPLLASIWITQKSLKERKESSNNASNADEEK